MTASETAKPTETQNHFQADALPVSKSKGGIIMTEYRAAYVNFTVLTSPEHAHLTDDELMAEAVAEAKRAGIYGHDYTSDDGDIIGIEEDDIVIGMWTE